MKTIRFGFIGAGQIAHASALEVNSHPYAKVTAVQDINPIRLSAICTDHGISASYNTASELLADPDIDAVYIAVPNCFHAPLAKQALEAGKHVILDKPFALNASEAEQVIEASVRTGKIFTLGMNQRFVEKHQKVQSLVSKGTLGQIYHAKAYWYRRSGIPKLGTWFGDKEFAGAGCLFDIGVHVLDLCLYCINNFRPTSVYGTVYTKFGNRGLGEGSWGHSDKDNSVFNVEDFATALIRFADGSTVSLEAAWACHMELKSRMDVEIFGTHGGASVSQAKLFHRDKTSAEHEVITELDTLPMFPHNNRFANFINHILGVEELCVKPDQALAVQRILDAIVLSSNTNREIHI